MTQDLKSTPFTAYSPEECLPYLALRTVFINPKNPQQQITDEQIGRTICNKYTMTPNSFAQEFTAYQDQHAMGPIRDKLKANLDKISHIHRVKNCKYP